MVFILHQLGHMINQSQSHERWRHVYELVEFAFFWYGIRSFRSMVISLRIQKVFSLRTRNFNWTQSKDIELLANFSGLQITNAALLNGKQSCDQSTSRNRKMAIEFIRTLAGEISPTLFEFKKYILPLNPSFHHSLALAWDVNSFTQIICER